MNKYSNNGKVYIYKVRWCKIKNNWM